MILGICANPEVLKVVRIVKIVINIITISVPILMIIFGSIDLVKVISSGEDFNKTLKLLIRKFIATVLICLVPTFIVIILKIVDADKLYYSCFENATKSGIKTAYVNDAKLKVEKAKTNLDTGSYNSALQAVNDLEDESAKSSLKSELSNVKSQIQKKQEEASSKGGVTGSDPSKGADESSDSSSSGRVDTGNGGNTSGIRKDGKYTKAQVIAMDEQTVRDMSNQEFIEFIASAAQIVYDEIGGVLPSITIAQACLESGYGDHFETTSHNVYGLIGYPGSKPKVKKLRQFDSFYESTYYHATYFTNYPKVYTNFLNDCANNNPIHAAGYLGAYCGGSTTYGPTIVKLINQYNLTQYD